MKSTNKLNRNYLLFQLKSGKNAKLPYYVMGFLRRLMPDCFCRFRLNGVLKELDRRDDRDYIISRVDYYNTMTEVTKLPATARTATEYWKGFRCQKVYLHDSYRWTRWFPAHFRYVLKPATTHRCGCAVDSEEPPHTRAFWHKHSSQHGPYKAFPVC